VIGSDGYTIPQGKGGKNATAQSIKRTRGKVRKIRSTEREEGGKVFFWIKLLACPVKQRQEGDAQKASIGGRGGEGNQKEREGGIGKRYMDTRK